MMTYCIGTTDSAINIATEKLKGTPKQKIQEYYATRPQSVLNLATVDKVYNDKLTSVWDYSVAFFGECSNNLAKVPPDRINMASHCMQNQLMADVTHSYKTAGASKDKVYAHFSKFSETTNHAIIDKVYTSSLSRAEIKMHVWNNCMDVLVDKLTDLPPGISDL